MRALRWRLPATHGSSTALIRTAKPSGGALRDLIIIAEHYPELLGAIRGFSWIIDEKARPDVPRALEPNATGRKQC